MRNLYLVLLSLAILAVACQKEVNDFPPPPPPCEGLLTRIVQGTGIDDTVFIIKYDTLKRISALIDSVYRDTIKPTYTNESKYPDWLAFLSGDGISYAYNTTGKVTDAAGWGNRITMQYAGADQLAAAGSFYRDNNNWLPVSTFTFQQDANGNLVKWDEFNTSNVPQGTYEVTYTDILNPLNDLSYYNFGNMLGMDDIFPAFMFVHQSKYLPKTIRNGGLIFEISYGRNATGQLVSSVARLRNLTNNNLEYVATRYYYYTCE